MNSQTTITKEDLKEVREDIKILINKSLERYSMVFPSNSSV